MPSGSYNDSLAMKRADVQRTVWTAANFTVGIGAVIGQALSTSLACSLLATWLFPNGPENIGKIMALIIAGGLPVIGLHLMIIGEGRFMARKFAIALAWLAAGIILAAYVLAPERIPFAAHLWLIPAATMAMLHSTAHRQFALNIYVIRAAQRDSRRRLKQQLDNETR